METVQNNPRLVPFREKVQRTGEKEFVLKEVRSNKQNGKIDVVWLQGGSIPIAAFEIDSAVRLKSIRKLLTINSQLRVWIVYGQKNFDSFLRSEDIENSIILLRLEMLRMKELPNENGGERTMVVYI